MKKLQSLFILLTVFIYVQAQQSNHSDQESLKPVKYARTYLPRMNVLYEGIENEIFLTAFNIDLNNIKLSTSNGTITQKSKDKWFIKPDKAGETCSVEISDGDNMVYARQQYRVKKIPVPQIIIGKYKNNDLASARYLCYLYGISAENINFDYDVNYTVTEFAIRIVDKKGFQYIKSDSNKLTEKQKNIIESLPSGTILYFEDIKVKICDSIFYDMPVTKLIIE